MTQSQAPIAAAPEACTVFGLAHFVAIAADTENLAELTGHFAAAIADEGFDRHLCIAVQGDSGPVVLFGDAHHIPLDALRAIRQSPARPCTLVDRPSHGLLVPVQWWHDGLIYMLLTGSPAAADDAAIARLHGLAESYATFGYALFERQRDLATNAGLSLAQRRCLALILTGHSDFDISHMLALTPLSVRAHVHRAMTLLEVDTRAEAVAIAARRGWLVGLDEPHALLVSGAVK